MPMQRQTAKKMRIVDIVSGEFVKKEGMEPSYVVTPAKENVSRARISGTVVNKYTSEDNNFASVTIDDSTATLRAKLWKEIALLQNVSAGDLVNVTGKVREYEGEIYIVPEIVRTITPDEESLFRLEIIEQMKNRGTVIKASSRGTTQVPAQKVRTSPQPQTAPETAPAPQYEAEIETVSLDDENQKPSLRTTPTAPAAAQPQQEGENLRTKIMNIISQNPEGIKYAELMQQAGAPEEDMEDVVNELLGEGVCYEPMPGKIKKI